MNEFQKQFTSFLCLLGKIIFKNSIFYIQNITRRHLRRCKIVALVDQFEDIERVMLINKLYSRNAISIHLLVLKSKNGCKETILVLILYDICHRTVASHLPNINPNNCHKKCPTNAPRRLPTNGNGTW